MILEGVVTTLAPDGTLNVAPMGPDVSGGLDRFTLRPYQTSTTFKNLQANGAGVFHVTDDVWLLARAAIKQVGAVESRPASKVLGRILETSGRYLEFRVVALDATGDRSRITVETVARGEQATGLFGFNRAKHAVVEAAILATRLDFLPIDQILDEFRRLAVWVEKTGGPDEIRAFKLLEDHIQPEKFHEPRREHGWSTDQNGN